MERVPTFALEPTAPIPQACGLGPAAQGAYRFIENEAIREAHQQATLERVRAHPVVLTLQNTSTLNYTTHP